VIEGGGVPVYLAFLAGIVSFASACVLPIVPAFAIIIAGSVALDGETGRPRRPLRSALRFSTFFLLGFAAFFVLSGATAAAIGEWTRRMAPAAELLGAFAVGLFGLTLATSRIHRRTAAFGSTAAGQAALSAAALVGGVGFAAAWTPCIGPVLAEILLYGAFPSTLAEGLLLLGIYSSGLATPFLAIGAVVGWSVGRLSPTGGWATGARAALGMALVVFAGLLLTGEFSALTAYLSGFGFLLEFGL
jgi:cytochrome c-type biogenesis protein